MDNRQRILEEAANMFRTYGIRAMTMDMLANQMGMSKRTIYEIFRDKDELLVGVLKWMTARQREVMVEILKESENVIEAIFKILSLMRNHFQNMSPAFQMDIRKYHNDMLKKLEGANELPYVGNNTLIIERGMREGLFRKNLDVDIIDRSMHEIAKMMSNKDLFPPDDFPVKDIIRNVYLNFLRGISTQKGLELINHYEKMRKD